MNAPNQLSFLPEDYLENKAQRRANVICAVLFLVTMVSIGLAFTTSEHSLKEVEQKHAKIDQEFTEAAKRIQQVQQLQEKQRTMAHQAELTASLLEKVPRSLILAKVTNSLPQGCSLTDFVLASIARKNAPTPTARPTFAAKKPGASSAAPPVEAKVYDVSIRITGLAPTDTQVGDFIKKLKAIPLFKDVNLVVSDWEKADGTPKDKTKNTDDQYRKFQIEMLLDPNADVHDMADSITTASAGLNK